MNFFLCFLLGLFATFSCEAGDIHLTLDECVFVKYPVPEKGITCSNYERLQRLSKRLENVEVHKTSWGPQVIIGDYNGEKMFLAWAPVGSGSGLLFTELYVAGAKYILRYGSDDIKAPPTSDATLVKIIDETDNLYGYNLQSGVDPSEWGGTVYASPQMIEALVTTAEARAYDYEMRVCHHLENYHGLRTPAKFSVERQKRLEAMITALEANPKPSSYDMESAVLFRVARDFDCHAATILQTIDKEGKFTDAKRREQAMEIEESFFFDYVLEALSKLPNETALTLQIKA